MIPTWTVFDVGISQGAGREDAGSKRSWTSRGWGGKSEGRVFFFSFFLFFFFFLYHIFVVKVQEIAWSASYGENKTQNPKRTHKGKIRHQSSSTGVRTGPRPTRGHDIKARAIKETLLIPADSMKNQNKVNLANLRRHKVTKGNYIR